MGRMPKLLCCTGETPVLRLMGKMPKLLCLLGRQPARR